ncbi:MAG: ribonuclease HII, partial [Deltaproteobacteria bacterium]|nr:ribonuclease HII [Deltaproteobacteria bacterium]
MPLSPGSGTLKNGKILPPSFYLSPPENGLFKQGYQYIAGIDEAGRGPLAGPVVAAAVVLTKSHLLRGILDSKQLQPSVREKFFAIIQSQSLAFGLGIVDQWEIDRINIHKASLKAMEIAVNNLDKPVEYLLIDGLHPIESTIPQKAVKHGDCLSPVIGAA